MIENEQRVYEQIKELSLATGFVAADIANWQDDSYLVLALPYAPMRSEDSQVIARFACHDNYRKAVHIAKDLRKKIAPLLAVVPKQLEILCNSQTVNEKKLALLAGIGFYGKNSLIMVEPWGSFVVLLAIRLPHYFAWVEHEAKIASLCQSCDLCQRACPSQALHRAYHLDRTLCLQSMASNGILPISDNLPVIYGCDICQNVCPYNRKALQRFKELELNALQSPWCSAKLWEEGSLENINQAVAKSPLQFSWLDKKALLLNARIRAWHKLFLRLKHKEKEE